MYVKNKEFFIINLYENYNNFLIIHKKMIKNIKF